MFQRLLAGLRQRLRSSPRLGRLTLRLIPDIPVTIRITGIGPFRIRLRRNRSYWLQDQVTLESFPLACLAQWVHPGCTVYDVGANMGLYTRFFATYFGAGKVIAFEPMTDNLAQLNENIGLGNILDRVTVCPYALADVDGEQEFQLDDFSTASAALSVITKGEAAPGRKQYGLPAKSQMVVCRRLDSVIQELGLPTPDVIKVDIEGAESLFLLGARNCLMRDSPKLMVELHGFDQAHSVYHFLSDLGYHCAAKVSPRLEPSGYCRLDDAIVKRAQDTYDIHFLIAAKEPSALPQRIEPFQPTDSGVRKQPTGNHT